jgi:hypothetical protein
LASERRYESGVPTVALGAASQPWRDGTHVMTTDNEICHMDAVTLAAHLRSKDLSPVEVIEAVLSRM